MKTRDVLKRLHRKVWSRLGGRKPYLKLLVLLYIILLVLTLFLYLESKSTATPSANRRRPPMNSVTPSLTALRKSLEEKSKPKKFTYYLLNNQRLNLSTDEVLPLGPLAPNKPAPATLKERVQISSPSRRKSILLMWDVGFSQENLRGCKDWDCEVTADRSRFEEADAVFFQVKSAIS